MSNAKPDNILNSPIANPTNSPVNSPAANPAAGTPDTPAYLDFTVLRNEALTHLGNLTGKIWTDYNVHDPGITILEILCYALVDLDYRIKLPAADIFARANSAIGPDDNFYSPAQILACNPLTILDYRKMLSDLDGIRNAWVEVDSDEVDKCALQNRQIAINGLYRVYIELEDGTDMDKDAVGKMEAIVRQELRKHRNLCEDVAAITTVDKRELGIFAIIELNTDADPGQVYLDMMQAAGDFLSPSPHFYTLQELLDKNKPIDGIFAGRPCNTTSSHGFIDTNELAQIQLKKEIHLSDLYKALFQVKGIKTIRDLQWQASNGDLNKSWKYPLPPNTVIDFQPDCCGIQFLRNGKAVPFDASQYETSLQAGMKRTLYTTALPNLDLPFPKGTYRDDLADYYSIQNDFPNAYGIAKGGIPSNAPTERKAWALQLKGFLLFFDQLFADFLAQLSNIRSLFAMGGMTASGAGGADAACAGSAGASGAGKGSTYFLNMLNNSDDPDAPGYVPDVDKLLRSYIDKDLAMLLGSEGSTLVFPADRKTVVSSPGQSPEGFIQLSYTDWDQLQDAVANLKTDFAAGLTATFVSYGADQFYYYILTSSPDLVLLSKTFASETAARQHAGFVISNGMLDYCYSLFSIKDNKFTFTLRYEKMPLKALLRNDLEDAALYARRRKYFLDHLLSRFAEKFTDYALLQYGPANDLQKAQDLIGVQENYLSRFAEISSQRGQAGDYTIGSWNTDAISGFEKKWKALIGAANDGRRSLCNFIIHEAAPQYSFSLSIGEKTFFRPDTKFNSKESAGQAAGQLVTAMGNRSNYTVGGDAPDHTISLTYGDGYTALFADRYPTEPYAATVAGRLSDLFSLPAPQTDEPSPFFLKDVVPGVTSATRLKLQLLDTAGQTRMSSIQSYDSPDEAANAFNEFRANDRPPDAGSWQTVTENGPAPATLKRITPDSDVIQFIDADAFTINIYSPADRPDRFTYDLLPAANDLAPANSAFLFHAANDFDSSPDAQANANELLLLATRSDSYWVQADTSGLCTIWILGSGQRQAGCVTGKREAEANELLINILSRFSQKIYKISIGPEASRWRFHYYLGYEDASRISFDSVAEFDSKAAAGNALRQFWQQLPALRLEQGEGRLMLRSDDPAIEATATPPATVESAAPLLALQQEIRKAAASLTPSDYGILTTDPASKQGRFTWQLIDKDQRVAFCSRDYPDKDNAEKDKNRLAGLLDRGIRYLEICMDGKITRKRKDPLTQVYGYHYLLRCHNEFYSGSGRQKILLESVKGYPSEEEAKQAFAADCIPLLAIAAKEKSYGPQISLTETFSNNPSPDSPIAFIPKETKVSLGGTDTDVIKRMVALAGSFPLKREGSGPGDYLYYCGITIPDPAPEGLAFEWQSTHRFKTIAEAQLDFAFFIRLLHYSGNLFTDTWQQPDTSKPDAWRIYIHEVLAEGSRRFEKEEDAWGAEGVGGFICALRQEDTVLCYEKNDCANTFLVNSREPAVEHPCTYSTPGARDEAKQLLIDQSGKWNPGANIVYREGDFLILTDGQASPFAKAAITAAAENDLRLATELIQKIQDKTNRYKIEDNIPQLVSADGTIVIAIALQIGINWEVWKQQLELFADEYPFVPNSDGSFSIELKLQPGTAATVAAQSDAAATGQPVPPAINCYVAWRSTTTYPAGTDPQTALENMTTLLAQSDAYLSVFKHGDCRCFNIVFSDPKDKIAQHPQSYLFREPILGAVQRTRKTVNMEGFHLVEHILLRPRSDHPEDCDCSAAAYCSTVADCGFSWIVRDPDPCDPVKNTGFIPNSDPWSFIATVVLPAWPEKFSEQDNRVVLENILYREAPAHVMLRVLWLDPKDFCEFESLYKTWVKGIAEQKTSNKDFSSCGLVKYLFQPAFTTPGDYKPCPEPPASNASAASLESSRAKKLPDFSAQVSEFYCWKGTGQ